MLLKGMNDPLFKAYQHPKARLMISRFRGLAGDRRLSDWQVFCILVNGFTNYWYVHSGNFTINVTLTKTRQFDFMQDFLQFHGDAGWSVKRREFPLSRLYFAPL